MDSWAFRCLAVIGIVANALGSLLYGSPSSPDAPQSGAAVLGTFFFFASYLCGQISWGFLIQKALRRTPSSWESFFWGSSLYAVLLGTFGFFPVTGAESFPFWNFSLLFGMAITAYVAQGPFTARFKRPKNPFTAIALTIAALTFLGAARPHAFWDSLWYHLTSSRLWFETGRVHLPELFPLALKAGLWDYHFLLGQILVGGPGDGGLIAAHVFGQWAAVACALFSFLVLRDLRAPLSLSVAAILVGFAGSELFSVVRFAKNDWAAVFWGLCFLAFFLRREKAWLLGISAGLCFAAKFSSAFFLLPFLAQKLWRERKHPRALASLIIAFALAAAPILVRNAWLTGNPLFPAASGLFPTAFLGPSWRNISFYEGSTFTLAGLREKLTYLALDNPAVFGLMLFPFTQRAFGSIGKQVFLSVLFATMLFLFASGPKAEWRLAGAAVVLLACYGARSAELLLLCLPRPKFVVPAVTIAAILFFPASRELILHPWSSENNALRVRSWPTGAAMAWLRLHGEPSALAATLNEQRIYYLFPRPPIRAFDVPSLDLALSTAATPEQALEVFRAAGLRYLVLSAEFLDRYHNRQVCDWMYELSERHPRAVVFRTELSRVLDLQQVGE